MKPLSLMERKSLVKRGKARPKRSHSEAEVPAEVQQTKEHSITMDDFANAVQKVYLENIKNIKESDDEDFVKVPLIEAEDIWRNVQILIPTDKYKNMTDEEKIKLIQSDFKDFYKNFPIVSRYMICLGQYKSNALKRMIIRCKSIKELVSDDVNGKDKNKDTSDNLPPKDLNEKLWIERQADYVQFLWEEFQDEGFDKEEAKKIWSQTHEALSNEFKQFKQLHDDAEKKVKSDDIKHKKELLYEMSGRIVNGQQKLKDESTRDLINKLKDILFKQRFTNTVKQLTQLDKVLAISEGYGVNEYAKQEYDEELKTSFTKKNFRKTDINSIMT